MKVKDLIKEICEDTKVEATVVDGCEWMTFNIDKFNEKEFIEELGNDQMLEAEATSIGVNPRTNELSFHINISAEKKETPSA